MATYNKFNQFVEDAAHGVHDLATDALKIMLTNSAPVATNEIFANLTEISAGSGYSAGGSVATQSLSAQASGVYQLKLGDVTFTASGGTIGAFRYAVLYNDTPVSPADPLIAWWDYGSSITLQDGETLTVDMGATSSPQDLVLTIT